MISTDFKKQVYQLLEDILTCYELCENIRASGRLISTYELIHHLQTRFSRSALRILLQFRNLERSSPSCAESGDVEARQCLNVAMWEIQSSIQEVLKDALGRQQVSRTLMAEWFQLLSNTLAEIEANVLEGFNGLKERLGST